MKSKYEYNKSKAERLGNRTYQGEQCECGSSTRWIRSDKCCACSSVNQRFKVIENQKASKATDSSWLIKRHKANLQLSCQRW